jgi:hypothetical protein
VLDVCSLHYSLHSRVVPHTTLTFPISNAHNDALRISLQALKFSLNNPAKELLYVQTSKVRLC